MPAKIDKDGNASVTCDCGKPIIMVNKYGMFCEDMCGYEESKQAEIVITNMIEKCLRKVFK